MYRSVSIPHANSPDAPGGHVGGIYLFFSGITLIASTLLFSISQPSLVVIQAVILGWMLCFVACLIAVAGRSLMSLCQVHVCLTAIVSYQLLLSALTPTGFSDSLQHRSPSAVGMAVGYILLFLAIATAVSIIAAHFLSSGSGGRRYFYCQLTFGHLAVVGAVTVCAELCIQVAACDFDLQTWQQALLSTRWNRPWVRGSAWFGLMRHLLFMGPLILGVGLVSLRSIGSWFALGPILAIGLMLRFFDGSRAGLMMQIVGVFLFWWYWRRPPLVWTIAVGIAILAVAGPVAKAMVYSRSFGYSRASTLLASEREAGRSDASQYLSDDSLPILVQLVEARPTGETVVSWDKYALYVICHPIPRTWWSSKPTITADMYQGVKFHYVSWSMIGDFYCMGGAVFVVIGAVLFGGAAFLIDRIIPKQGQPSASELIVFGVIMLWMFYVCRGIQGAAIYSYYVAAVPTLVFVYSRHQSQRRFRGTVYRTIGSSPRGIRA